MSSFTYKSVPKPRALYLTTALAILVFAGACSSADDSNAGGGAASSGASGSGSSGSSGSSGDGGRGGLDAANRPAVVHPGAMLGVDLGTAGGYAILAKSGVSTVPPSAITGNVGVSPVAASYLTGFSLTADSTNVFATSPQVIGHLFAADYTSPTPANLTTAIGDMELASTHAAPPAPDLTELGAGNIGGMTLPPAVYKWGTGLLVPTDIALDGSATDVWIFQIAQGLTVSSATRVYLSGGALAKNVYWQVSGAVDLGTTAHFEGIILTQTAITLRTDASINGRLLAQTAVTLDSSTVVAPAP